MVNRQTHEKMLKITSYQGNANKIHFEFSYHHGFSFANQSNIQKITCWLRSGEKYTNALVVEKSTAIMEDIMQIAQKSEN